MATVVLLHGWGVHAGQVLQPELLTAQRAFVLLLAPLRNARPAKHVPARKGHTRQMMKKQAAIL